MCGHEGVVRLTGGAAVDFRDRVGRDGLGVMKLLDVLVQHRGVESGSWRERVPRSPRIYGASFLRVRDVLLLVSSIKDKRGGHHRAYHASVTQRGRRGFTHRSPLDRLLLSPQLCLRSLASSNGSPSPRPDQTLNAITAVHWRPSHKTRSDIFPAFPNLLVGLH